MYHLFKTEKDATFEYSESQLQRNIKMNLV